MTTAGNNRLAQLGRTPISALIVAGLLENYYTCLETIFLRISQSFENNLNSARWHHRSYGCSLRFIANASISTIIAS